LYTLQGSKLLILWDVIVSCRTPNFSYFSNHTVNYSIPAGIINSDRQQKTVGIGWLSRLL